MGLGKFIFLQMGDNPSIYPVLLQQVENTIIL